MQENQITLYLYANRTELQAQFSLPDTMENFIKFLVQKVAWDKKDILNLGNIQFEYSEEQEIAYVDWVSWENWKT